MKTFPTPSRILFTQEGYDDVLAEKRSLLAERPDAVEQLRKAREMGDLSENGYYKAARARLSSIDARLRRLERLVRLGKVVANVPTGTVGFGSKVMLESSRGSQEFTIVGGYESDPGKGTISHISPLGKLLMGRKAGDVVTLHAPKGDMAYTIASIS
jgi:transcription elongation factor GreA